LFAGGPPYPKADCPITEIENTETTVIIKR
jgi:hypothetical protein